MADLEDLIERVKKISEEGKKNVNLSGVGIFWLTKDKSNFIYSTPNTLKNGDVYGNYINPRDDHFTTWENLRVNGIVEESSEYEDFPRGRVIYDTVKKRYQVLVGNWWTPECKFKIMGRYRLPSDFDVIMDERYDL